MKNLVSIILGSITAILPQVIFYKVFMKNYGAVKAKEILKCFYMGELLKWLLTIIVTIFFLNFNRLFAPYKIDVTVFIKSYILVVILQNFFWVLIKKRSK